ncbi:MAG: hypothetical protein ACK5VI_01505 [Opitutia bacterium]
MEDPARHPVARAGKVLGRYTLEAVKLGLATSRFLPGDHIWAAGEGRWVTLAELGRLNPGLFPDDTGAAAARGGGFWSGVGGFLGKAGGGVVTLFTYLIVISVGLFIGMLVQSGGRNPNRQGDNDPLRDPYAGRRDPDFGDRDA